MIVLQYKPDTLCGKEALDARLAQLTESSFALLELIFPRHIIEFMSDSHQQTPEEQLPRLRQLTTSHEQVGGLRRGPGVTLTLTPSAGQQPLLGGSLCKPALTPLSILVIL